MSTTSTISIPNRNGSQEPSYQHIPPAFASYGQQAIQFLHSVDFHLDPWQETTLRTLFAVDADKRWQVNEFGCLVSRQNGKGQIITGYLLCQLFLVPKLLNITEKRRRSILLSAHLYETALDSFGRLIAVIRSNDHLLAAVDHIYEGRGSESILLRKRPGQLQGDVLKVTARSAKAGRGLPQVDCLILDEAQSLSLSAYNALSYTQAQVDSSQALFFGTVPEDGVVDGEVFESIRDRGRAGTETHLAWLEWSPIGSNDPDTAEKLLADAAALAAPEHWISSVPSAGIRMGWATVLAEYNSAVAMRNLEGFARERLSIWPDRRPVTDEADELNELDLEAWYETGIEGVDASIVTGPHQVIAVAFGNGGGYASVSLASRHDEETFNVAHVKTAPGSAWVVPYIATLKAERHDALIVMDKYNAAPIINALELAKLKPIWLDQIEVAGAYANFLELVNTHRAWHPDQQAVTQSLKFSKTRPVGKSGLTFAQSTPKEPITQAMSVAWALFGVLKHEAMKSRSAPPSKVIFYN